MINYFKKFEKIKHNSELDTVNTTYQDIDNNKIILNSQIDTLTNREKDIIIYQIKGTIKRINPKNISITKLDRIISSYLFILQLDLQMGHIDPISFLINRGVLWELFKYYYEYKTLLLKLTIQLKHIYN